MNLEAIGDLLVSGPERLADLSGRTRCIRGIFSPQNRPDVLRIVRWASENAGTKLHPISCGNNWGFGSHLPPEDDAYVVNLAGLNRIRHLDLVTGFVELEPGVTQGMLDAALKERTHYFNVTGAGTDTSVLGNALERGIGYFGPRHEDLLDLEILLSDGRIIRTARTTNNPYHTGLGPNLTQLFVQSTFGIVLSAKIRLFKRPEHMGVVIVRPRPEASVESLVEIFAALQAEGLVRSVPHIANRQRAYFTFAPYMPREQREAFRASLSVWSAIVPINGSRRLMESMFAEIAERIKGVADCQLVSTWMNTPDPAGRSLLDLAQGMPNNIALPGVALAALGLTEEVGTHLEAGNAGLIHVVPACAPRGPELKQLLAIVQLATAGVALPMTVNLVNAGMAVVVISVPFDRRDNESRNSASKIAKSIRVACQKQDFLPYRLGLDDSSRLTVGDDERSKLLHAIRSLLDPKRIFCRSRYLYERQYAASASETEDEGAREVSLELVEV